MHIPNFSNGFSRTDPCAFTESFEDRLTGSLGRPHERIDIALLRGHLDGKKRMFNRGVILALHRPWPSAAVCLLLTSSTERFPSAPRTPALLFVASVFGRLR